MKKWVSILVAVMMVFTMIGAVCGCGAEKSEAAEIFAGQLIDAQGNSIVVKGPSETMLFETTESTVYDLKDQDKLCVSDMVEVDYHKGEDAFVADTVRLTSHEEEAMVFGGVVTELEKAYLTVQAENLTAVFIFDEETKITGDLSTGDSVTITYEGNISENPRALSIVVVKEKQEIEEKSIHGTVSELGITSVVISVDSAHAARFHLNSDTTFSGDDTRLKIGDEVDMVYRGSAGSDPVAVSIKIKRKQNPQYFVVDGVIEKVGSTNLVVRTSKKAVRFTMNKDTKIQNRDYLAAGHRTTITYTGDLNKQPTAVSVFCSKDIAKDGAIKQDDKDKKKADEKKQDEKQSAEPADSGSKGNNDEAAKPDESAKPDDSKDSGEQAEPADSGESGEQAEPSDSKDSGEQAEPADSEESGEQAEPADSKDSGEQAEPADSEESGEQAEPDDSKDSGEQAEPADSKESGEQAEADEKPAPEQIIIKARGEIIEMGNPVVIKVEGGTTIKLDITDAEIAGGYIPQAGDQVIINYDKDTLKMISIQLEYRNAPVSDTAEETTAS